MRAMSTTNFTHFDFTTVYVSEYKLRNAVIIFPILRLLLLYGFYIVNQHLELKYSEMV